MNYTNKAPGVYIQEISKPGPIPGVATSVAAFIGPALNGPTNEPVQLTNWSQFTSVFGDADGNVYSPSTSVYVTYAVRGFFDNGGANCYFVRVGKGQRAWLTLNDKKNQPTLMVEAQREGAAGNNIKIAVTEAHIVQNVEVISATTAITEVNASKNVIVVDNVNEFMPGDIVSVEKDDKKERREVESKNDKQIKLTEPLSGDFAPNTVRIADLEAGQMRFRLKETKGIERGSYIRLKQGAKKEDCTVASVNHLAKFIVLDNGLKQGYEMVSNPPKVTSLEFTLQATEPKEIMWEGLSMDPRHSQYYAAKIKSDAISVKPCDPPNSTKPPDNLPKAITETPLVEGTDDNIPSLNDEEYKAAINTLQRIDDVTIISVPDKTNNAVQKHLVEHCEKMGDRFAILDAPAPAAGEQSMPEQLKAIENHRLQLSSASGYAAYYYPRIYVANPFGNGRILVPPSGHIAGLYARIDDARGVHKAPANAALRGALGVEVVLTDDEQGPLNEKGINVLRTFPGRGVMVWGARTIAPADITQWRYLNVRRLLLFIEESIQEGTRFAVFEPNNRALWQTVKRQVTDFLTRIWRTGALVGATPDEAFEVRVDEELNPPSAVALGQLAIQIKLYPTTPAEFIEFRIIQQPGGPSVQE